MLFYLFLFKDGGHSLDSLQRACTFEAELALLLRISYKYGKSGAQVLFSMGILDHLASGRAISLQVFSIYLLALLFICQLNLLKKRYLQGGFRRVETRLRRDMAVDVDRQQMIVTPVLRLVFSLTSLVDASNFLEVGFYNLILSFSIGLLLVAIS